MRIVRKRPNSISSWISDSRPHGIGFVISAFFGGDSPLRMIGAYAGQLVAGLTFIAFPYPVTSFESFHAMSIRGVTRLTRIIGLVLSVSAVVLIVLTLR